jgi:hypothetical protein
MYGHSDKREGKYDHREIVSGGIRHIRKCIQKYKYCSIAYKKYSKKSETGAGCLPQSDRNGPYSKKKQNSETAV